jgi:hypothetical protein
MTSRKMTMNGSSMRVASVADVKKSRNDSNSWSWLAKEPTEAGRALSWRSMT